MLEKQQLLEQLNGFIDHLQKDLDLAIEQGDEYTKIAAKNQIFAFRRVIALVEQAEEAWKPW